MIDVYTRLCTRVCVRVCLYLFKQFAHTYQVFNEFPIYNQFWHLASLENPHTHNRFENRIIYNRDSIDLYLCDEFD